jgi:enoyl-CoA hydratase/carnithine racemase
VGRFVSAPAVGRPRRHAGAAARAGIPQNPAVPEIRFELDQGVALLTLDRPAQLNAFTGAMGRELGAAYRACDSDDAVRVVVLTGAGRAFCAGADLGAGEATFAAPGAGFSAAGVDPPAFALRKPVIAAMNGHAVGIGLTLALQCDVRLVADEGKYGVVQVRRGVLPDAYAHWTLPRIAGLSRAAELLLSGRLLRGEEAVAFGIASRSLPAGQVLHAALEQAREIARETAPLSVALSKRLLWRSLGLGPDEVGRLETELHLHLMGKPDALEGVRAHLERRPPRFSLQVSRDWPEWPDEGGA